MEKPTPLLSLINSLTSIPYLLMTITVLLVLLLVDTFIYSELDKLQPEKLISFTGLVNLVYIKPQLMPTQFKHFSEINLLLLPIIDISVL